MSVDKEIENFRNKIDDLQAQIDKLELERTKKHIHLTVVEATDTLIKHYSGSVISAHTSAIMSSCAQLRALLIVEDHD